MDSENQTLIEVRHASTDLAVSDFNHKSWDSAQPVHIARYWSGEEAPVGRTAEARILRSSKALHIRFVCNQAEPLVVSATPQLEKKTMGLWDRDVCEIFIAPDPNAVERYLEFEAAPTGEWLDVAIPWNHWIHEPQTGERWRVNLFRCVGSDPVRGYLAWQPTRTPQPNFHVPQVFGWLIFK